MMQKMNKYEKLREYAKSLQKTYLKEGFLACFAISFLCTLCCIVFLSFQIFSVEMLVVFLGVFSICFVLWYVYKTKKKENILERAKLVIADIICDEYDMVSVVKDIILKKSEGKYEFSCYFLGYENVSYNGYVSYDEYLFHLNYSEISDDFRDVVKYDAIQNRIQTLFKRLSEMIHGSGSSLSFSSDSYDEKDVISEILELKYGKKFVVSNFKKGRKDRKSPSLVCYSFSFSDEDDKYFGTVFPHKRIIEDDYPGEITNGFPVGDSLIIDGIIINRYGMSEVSASNSLKDSDGGAKETSTENQSVQTKNDGTSEVEQDANFTKNVALLYKELQKDFRLVVVNEQDNFSSIFVIISIIVSIFFVIPVLYLVFASMLGVKLFVFGAGPSAEEQTAEFLAFSVPILVIALMTTIREYNNKKRKREYQMKNTTTIQKLLKIYYGKLFVVTSVSLLIVDGWASGYKFSFSDKTGEYNGEVLVYDEVLRTNYPI